MIYITGDTHGDFWRFDPSVFPEQKEMTKDDYVIICGDFGGIWCPESPYKINGQDKHNLELEGKQIDKLNELPFTLLFVDGNHENFDRLYDYAIIDWHGGKVHRIAPSVYHLMRGQVYEICGKVFFTFGGASSHDVSDGIIPYDNEGKWIDEARELYKQFKGRFRIDHLSWWKQELPSQEEMQEGLDNLEKNCNHVDYIITHSPSASDIAKLGHGAYKQDILTKYLEEIKQKAEYKKWFCGHMHVDKNLSDKEIVLYEQIIRLV